MFPVPQHLPRSINEHQSSNEAGPSRPDPVLNLLAGVFEGDGKSFLSVDRVRSARQQLETSITENKLQSHKLLQDNYPSVSTHIRLGHSLHGDFARLQQTLSGLERQIDADDPETSFLPPVVALLERHFSAVRSRARAQSHKSALTALSNLSERIRKLESAIWAGRGADEWVIKDLLENKGDAVGQEVLRGVKVQDAAQKRIELFKSMVIEQVTDAFGKAVSFSDPSDGKHGISISVQTRISLQQPRIPRPQDVGSPVKSNTPPPYSLSQLYTTLSTFSALAPALSHVRTKLLKDLLPPLMSGSWKINRTSAETLSILRLERASGRQQPKEIIDGTSAVLSFIEEAIFPTASEGVSEREPFLAEIQQAVLRSVLDNVILPAMPPSLPSIPAWLELVHHTIDMEGAHTNVNLLKVIRPFFESEAGTAWATERRRRIVEETRKLILGGWGGWEAVEAEREKEVVMVVEVEVDYPEPTTTTGGEEGFGWTFDNEKKSDLQSSNQSAAGGDDTNMDVEEGWGFEDGETPRAGPSQSPKNGRRVTSGQQAKTGDGDEEMGEGWDFDDITPVPVSEPPKPIIAKPAREAKRLGKKVAKAKAAVDDDPWGSGSESIQSSVVPDHPHIDNGDRAVAEPEGWGWDEPPARSEPPPAQPKADKTKRKELKEETRVIRETFLVSRACDMLVDIADRALREANKLTSTELPSPSFVSAVDVLLASATDVFDLHRSLLPSHYSAQLRDVPTLAMQLHNDAIHLATRVEALRAIHPTWGADDLGVRLRSLADHSFETQMTFQLEGIMEVIDEADGFVAIGSDVGLRRCEKAIHGVVHNLESLSRVLKAVLPMTTYLSALGYLLDEAVSRISNDILSLLDITELESERLNDLLKSLRPLEEIFVVEPGQPSTVVAHVPHWLKFCYISELLQANLVDILYLFDSGALIDFTTDELVSLVRALFADSEKRDNAIERIENGVPGMAVDQA